MNTSSWRNPLLARVITAVAAAALVAGTGLPALAASTDPGETRPTNVSRPQGVSVDKSGADRSGRSLQATQQQASLLADAGPAISRGDILARAQTWASMSVPYSQSAYLDGYRTDCSGYVSMAWATYANYWTGNLNTIGVQLGSYNDLRPGDMLLYHNAANPVNGSHVVLFERWTGAVGGDFYIYEQTPPATKHRLWSQAGYSRSLYLPFKYVNVMEDPVATGDTARVVYRSGDGHIHDLSVSAASPWRDFDLSSLIGAPAAIDNPFGYTTNLAGQSQVARVVYRTGDGHIHELSVGNGSGWRDFDLTGMIGAPPAVDSPFAYTTNLDGQSQVARVLYRTGDGHIHELSVGNGSGWRDFDLTGMIGAPAAIDRPFGYTTNLAGQTQVARVLYRTGDGHIHELGIGNGTGWRDFDLTGMLGIPSAMDRPSAYVTNLPGQGPVARVVYRSSNGHVHDLNVSGTSGWTDFDLTGMIGAPAAIDRPVGYTTTLAGQEQVARVLYRTGDNHIHELSVGNGSGWRDFDLTGMIGAPSAIDTPFPYTTNLAGQTQVARMVYRTGNGHIHELGIGNGSGWRDFDLTGMIGAPTAIGSPSGYATNV